MPHTSFATRMITQSDAEAEALIGRVRMFIGSVLLIAVSLLLIQVPLEVYALRQTELTAALVVSSCYLALGIGSNFLAKTVYYKPLYGLIFGLTEVALVLCNAYFDIIDPNTSSLFVLASPILLMIVIVLVLQVLRYSLAVHVTISIALILGLVAILGYDMQIGSPPAPQLIDELLSLYSVPPNIVRLLMLAILATIIALAIFRSRKLMEKIAHELEESQNRNRFLPAELTNHLSDEDIVQLRTGRTRNVVIMMVDLRGFTSLTQQFSTNQIAQLLNQYRTIVMEVVSQHDGIIDKFIGDGVMCVFGLEGSFHDATDNAIFSSLEINRRWNDWNTSPTNQDAQKLDVVFALGGGEALVAALGPQDRLEFTAIGPVVNSVSRMESFAKENDIMILASDTVYKAQTVTSQSTTNARFREVGSTRFRGEQQETKLWALEKSEPQLKRDAH